MMLLVRSAVELCLQFRWQWVLKACGLALFVIADKVGLIPKTIDCPQHRGECNHHPLQTITSLTTTPTPRDLPHLTTWPVRANRSVPVTHTLNTRPNNKQAVVSDSFCDLESSLACHNIAELYMSHCTIQMCNQKPHQNNLSMHFNNFTLKCSNMLMPQFPLDDTSEGHHFKWTFLLLIIYFWLNLFLCKNS